LAENEQRVQLSAAQKRAVAALLTERDIRSAAVAAKVGESTLRRWLRDDLFMAELRKAENDVIDRVTRRMLQVQEASLAVVVSILANKETNANTRLRAAGMIFDNFVKLRELRNVEERLAAMETALREMGAL
jgi:phage antirepressor YoqD-like protein